MDVNIGTSRTAVFGTVVPERIKRNILAIVLISDGTDRTVEIEKLEEDGTTYTMIFDDYRTGTTNSWIPPSGFDIENPVILLEGGTNLYLKASSAIPATVIYYDDEL